MTVALAKRANSVADRLRVWTGEMALAALRAHLRAEAAWSLTIGTFLQHIKRGNRFRCVESRIDESVLVAADGRCRVDSVVAMPGVRAGGKCAGGAASRASSGSGENSKPRRAWSLNRFNVAHLWIPPCTLGVFLRRLARGDAGPHVRPLPHGSARWRFPASAARLKPGSRGSISGAIAKHIFIVETIRGQDICALLGCKR